MIKIVFYRKIKTRRRKTFPSLYTYIPRIFLIVYFYAIISVNNGNEKYNFYLVI